MKMESNVILVVGDRFAGFVNKPGVMTASELEWTLQQGDTLNFGNESVFVPGQGLSYEQMLRIYEEAVSRQFKPAFEHWEATLSVPMASGELTHKHKPENSLVGVPRRVGQDHFELDLMIDDRNEIMSDHVTGQHLQGMLLLEACRQAFLAVTEKFFLSEHPERSYYFILNNISVSYHAFAFPVRTKIAYRIVESASPDAGRHSFVVEMEVLQGGEVTTSVRTKFTAFDSAALKPKEQKKAEQALRQMQTAVSEAPPLVEAQYA